MGREGGGQSGRRKWLARCNDDTEDSHDTAAGSANPKSNLNPNPNPNTYLYVGYVPLMWLVKTNYLQEHLTALVWDAAVPLASLIIILM